MVTRSSGPSKPVLTIGVKDMVAIMALQSEQNLSDVFDIQLSPELAQSEEWAKIRAQMTRDINRNVMDFDAFKKKYAGDFVEKVQNAMPEEQRSGHPYLTHLSQKLELVDVPIFMGVNHDNIAKNAATTLTANVIPGDSIVQDSRGGRINPTRDPSGYMAQAVSMYPERKPVRQRRGVSGVHLMNSLGKRLEHIRGLGRPVEPDPSRDAMTERPEDLEVQPDPNRNAMTERPKRSFWRRDR